MKSSCVVCTTSVPNAAVARHRGSRLICSKPPLIGLERIDELDIRVVLAVDGRQHHGKLDPVRQRRLVLQFVLGVDLPGAAEIDEIGESLFEMPFCSRAPIRWAVPRGPAGRLPDQDRSRRIERIHDGRKYGRIERARNVHGPPSDGRIGRPGLQTQRELLKISLFAGAKRPFVIDRQLDLSGARPGKRRSCWTSERSPARRPASNTGTTKAR